MFSCHSHHAANIEVPQRWSLTLYAGRISWMWICQSERWWTTQQKRYKRVNRRIQSSYERVRLEELTHINENLRVGEKRKKNKYNEWRSDWKTRTTGVDHNKFIIIAIIKVYPRVSKHLLRSKFSASVAHFFIFSSKEILLDNLSSAVNWKMYLGNISSNDRILKSNQILSRATKKQTYL